MQINRLEIGMQIEKRTKFRDIEGETSGCWRNWLKHSSIVHGIGGNISIYLYIYKNFCTVVCDTKYFPKSSTVGMH